jgi:hypothetical protein
MNMLGTNNLDVFDLMMNWANENIHNAPKATTCKTGKGGRED